MSRVRRVLRDGRARGEAVLQHSRRGERGSEGELSVAGRLERAREGGAEPQGLKLGLEGEVEKHSDVLGRTALWKKTMQISSLPKVLCVMVLRSRWG